MSGQAIEFFCPYAVGPKGNSKRAFMAGGKLIVRGDPKSAANAAALRGLFVQHSPAVPLECPVRVTYQVQYAWRKGDSAKRRAMGMQPKDTRPDMGQLEKQLDDVLQAAGFVVDDAQIVERGAANGLRHGKFLADRPGVHVRIEALNGSH